MSERFGDPPSDREWIRSLEDQLATLRSEVAHVRGRLEDYADIIERLRAVGEIESLIDALREDARRLEKLGGGDQ